MEYDKADVISPQIFNIIVKAVIEEWEIKSREDKRMLEWK